MVIAISMAVTCLTLLLPSTLCVVSCTLYRERVAAMAAIVFRRRPQSATTRRDSSAAKSPTGAHRSVEARIATAVTAGLYVHRLAYDTSNRTHTHTPLSPAIANTVKTVPEIVLIAPASTLVGIGASANPVVFHSLYAGKDGVYVRHLARADPARLEQLTRAYTPVEPAALCVFDSSAAKQSGTADADSHSQGQGQSQGRRASIHPQHAGSELAQSEKGPRRQSFISIKLPPSETEPVYAVSAAGKIAVLTAVVYALGAFASRKMGVYFVCPGCRLNGTCLCTCVPFLPKSMHNIRAGDCVLQVLPWNRRTGRETSWKPSAPAATPICWP